MFKSFFKNLIALGILSLLSFQVQAQEPDGLSCVTANPFCSDSAYYFPNFSSGDGVSAPPEPDYGCLFSQPNPIWYYMQIDDPGTMQISIHQTSLTGAGIDVDFAMWGPFSDLAEGCAEIMSGTLYPLQCSYSASASETIGLGMAGGFGAGASTPPEAETGDIYIVILTNFSGQPGNISFEQTAGTATTDCSIINCGLTLTANTEVCQGETVYFNAEESANEGTVEFFWTGPGGFTSTASDPSVVMNEAGEFLFTCMSVVTLEDETDTCIEEISVIVNPVYHDILNVEICEGELYTWYDEVYYSTGTYTRSFTTVNGCDSIHQLNLKLNPMPDVRVNTLTPSICEGDEAIITMLNPNDNYSYQWTKNGTPIAGATTQSFAATEAGEYRVIAVTDKGCTDTSRVVTVFVNPPAVANILNLDVNTAELCIGDTVTFVAEYFPNYEYRWSPDRFFRYIQGSRTHEVLGTILEPAMITLEAFNEYGCKASDSLWVQPVPCCDVYLPTAFSPNNDGLNDYFNILLQPGQRVVTFQIFDRRGTLVYDNTSPQGWDGRDTKGREVGQDVYFYRIVYSCTDKENYEKKGDITLVR